MIKKTLVFIMLTLLLFAGCQSSQPANAGQDSQTAVLGTESKPRPLEVKNETGDRPLAVQAPMPDVLPATSPNAVELPDDLVLTSTGYELKLLTPAQYVLNVSTKAEKNNGFPTVDVFRLKSKDGEKVALANENGKIITDFVYDECENENFSSDNKGIVLSKRGKYGVVDGRTGEECIPFLYDRIERKLSDTYQCAIGDTEKLIDQSGKVLLTYDRGDHLSVFSDNYLLLADGMLRFYDDNAQPLKNFACEEIDPYVNEDLVFVNCGGNWGIYDADGDVLVEPQYDGLDDFNEQCEAVVYTKNNKKGVLDLNGDLLIKAQWDDVALYDSSASVEKDDKWGAFTNLSSDQPEIEPMYDYIYAFGQDGCAAYEHKGKFGILDEQGNVLISAKYETMASNSDSELKDGYYVIDGDGSDLSGIIRGKGNVVIPSTYSIIFSKNSKEPYHLIQNQRGKWGYIDRTGQMMIDTKFDNAGGFLPRQDVAFVRQNGKISLIDRKGTVVLQTKFTDLSAYNPNTMVGAFVYNDEQGNQKVCLAKVQPKP